MNPKIEVTVDIIIHATEDIKKFFAAFEEIFELKKEDFSTHNLKGHFDNPITMLQIKLVKNSAKSFVEKLVSDLPKNQQHELLENLEDRIHNSAFHVRLDKQKLISGILELKDKDPVKVKIFTPIYNKKDMAKIYSELLKITN